MNVKKRIKVKRRSFSIPCAGMIHSTRIAVRTETKRDQGIRKSLPCSSSQMLKRSLLMKDEDLRSCSGCSVQAVCLAALQGFVLESHFSNYSFLDVCRIWLQ